MKVILVNTLYYPDQVGGAEMSVQLLAEGLVQQGHDVSVVCLSRGLSPRFERVKGVKVFRIKLFNLYWPFGKVKAGPVARLVWHILEIFNPVMVWRFSSIVKTVRPDIVHTNNVHGFSTGIWVYLSIKRLPIVHTIRDYALMCSRGSLYRAEKRCESLCLDCKLLCRVKRKHTRHVSTVVGISQYVLDRHIKQKFFTGRHTEIVVHNSVADSVQLIDKIHCQQSKHEFVFGFIGRLVAEKGVMDLVSSFNRLRQQYADIALVIAGVGNDEYESILKEASGESIEFLGHVDPQTFYKSVNAVVVPSLWDEPFGRTVAEALAAGCAVICSNRGGLPELANGRANCQIFDPQIEGALLGALKRAKDACSNGNTTGNAPHDSSIKQELSPKTTAEKYTRLYKAALSDRIRTGGAT